MKFEKPLLRQSLCYEIKLLAKFHNIHFSGFGWVVMNQSVSQFDLFIKINNLIVY